MIAFTVKARNKPKTETLLLMGTVMLKYSLRQPGEQLLVWRERHYPLWLGNKDCKTLQSVEKHILIGF